MHQTIGVPSVETPASWTVATVVLVILALSFGAPWITIIALKMIAAELGGLRSVPAFATALAWVGFGTGGIAMGYVAERVGVRATVITGAVMICIGLALSTGGATWQLYVGQGLFVGFLGVGGMNAPFYVYISRWFDRRRGSALALISSGSYVAGAIWPPIFERAVAYAGWRQTMLYYGLIEAAVVVPLAAMFLRPPPELLLRNARVQSEFERGHRAVAGDGAAMLSVLLGTAFVSRQFWGWVSDRMGGLNTVLAGSACQIAAMSAFLFTQDEIGLFTVSAGFGLGFAGIIPAYILAIRELFPASQAYWRIPTFLFGSGSGMAIGGWLAGALYDHFGTYAPAFAAGIGANAINLAMIGTLVFRQKSGGAARGEMISFAPVEHP